MTKDTTPKTSQYNCSERRVNMILLGLRQQLRNPNLTEAEKKKLAEEIARIEKELDF